MCYTYIECDLEPWKKKSYLNAEKYDDGANESWRWWRHDNNNAVVEEEEVALRRKHIRNAQERWEGKFLKFK